MPRTLFPILLAAVMLVPDAGAARRRAVRHPATRNLSTPAAWLAHNAHPLTTVELTTDDSDLEPLRSIAGSARVVGLGDGTHGTHEFYTVKHRLVDFLVREMSFDVLAFEAPFPTFNALDQYVQGGGGDPRALLKRAAAVGYVFWDSEEILAVIEWMRAYNAHRGERPAVHIVGIDTQEGTLAAAEVVAYLQRVDSAAARAAEAAFTCIPPFARPTPSDCQKQLEEVRNDLISKRADFTARTSEMEFEEALQYATVVTQSRWAFGDGRDAAMATNVLWTLEHRGVTGKAILWAHGAHVARARSDFAGTPMGWQLARQLGSGYVAMGTMTRAGSFIGWSFREGTFTPVVRTFDPILPGSYESLLMQAGKTAMLLPLRPPLPAWFPAEGPYNMGSAGDVGPMVVNDPLPQQFDAVVYIDTTTPMRLLP